MFIWGEFTTFELLGAGLYVLFRNWGALNPSFFISAGSMSCIFGGVITWSTWLGTLGFNYQLKDSGVY